ncbi:MAG: 1-acyl-sn-glycerol-3-phosphate acyltransferase [Chloroflexi bacterium]|nr:1-acyl-sn-glycerol-3-phosphate acyltransferase [Chloroflexota bacterium]
MTLTERIANAIIKAISGIICRIDADQLKNVPHHGPMIIITNHINFLEAPILYTLLMPRPMTAFGKLETWNGAFMAWLFNLWGIIPIKRGEPDRKALRAGLAALKNGQFLGIAPEGTRSNDGQLLKGQSGVVMMALLSGAPLIPIVHYGSEKYRYNLKRFKRTDVKIIVGKPFTLNPGDQKVTRALREQMTTDIMVQMAKLLPPAYRGEYSDLSRASEDYLRF